MKWRNYLPHLIAGFSLAALSGELLAAPPAILAVRQAVPREITERIRSGQIPSIAGRRVEIPVRMYEKLELRIDLSATFTNAFDPDEVDLSAQFTAPSGKVWNIWGFYNPSGWDALWMVRFTPNEIGTWRYVVKVRDCEGAAESEAANFEVTPSEHHGFLQIAANKRYLRYTDGTSFYGVGLWYNDAYEQFNSGQIRETDLDTLRRSGANFISFYPTPLETMGTGLGRYDQNRAGRLDEIFEWCEQRGIHISWNLWFHSYISETIWGGGNARYRNNPYRTIAKAEDFFGSDEAWKYEQKLHRYIVARWGYSRALFLWFIVDEINGTEGFLQNRPQAEEWSRKMHDWFKANDPYGRPTTGTQSGGIRQWWPEGYAIFDIAAREIYEAQGHAFPAAGKPDPIGNHPLQFSYLNYAKQSQDLWNGFEKPAIIGETGWDHTYYEPGMPGYLAMYHNSLWAGLANGLCTTPFWWAYGSFVNDSVMTRTLSNFARFVRDIDFAKLDPQPVALEVSNGHGWAIHAKDITFGWFVNPSTGVANESFAVPGLEDGEYDVHLYRTWKGEYQDPVSATSAGGKLNMTVPELKPVGGRAQNIGDDIAFKLVKKGAPR